MKSHFEQFEKHTLKHISNASDRKCFSLIFIKIEALSNGNLYQAIDIKLKLLIDYIFQCGSFSCVCGAFSFP